jgi:ABC-type transport system, involved in lipoprotein release, permease component
MFNGLTQIGIITVMNLRNLPQRIGTSSVAVFGVACVVGVLIGVMSMASGFQRTMTNAGSPTTAIVMRTGATSELNSGINYEQSQLIANSPGIQRADGEPVASPELFVIVDLLKRATQSSANVPLRGVGPSAFAVRDSVKIIEGRNFEAGRNELIVGRGAHSQFANLDVGSTINFGATEWTVVGIFTAGGGLSESELWCDSRILQNAYRRGNSFQSVRVKLTAPEALSELKTAIASNPQLEMDAQLETDYLAAQAEPVSMFIKAVGYPVAILMALGAIFGAINTMYASVSTRTREIATLRALGFGSFPVAFSTLFESLVLSLIGGAVGSVIVFLLFNGYSVSTLNFSSFSQVVFDFAVTIDLLIQGVFFAAIIGLIGGLFPAIRVAKLPVATALRET